jgi:hypothetical protein
MVYKGPLSGVGEGAAEIPGKLHPLINMDIPMSIPINIWILILTIQPSTRLAFLGASNFANFDQPFTTCI